MLSDTIKKVNEAEAKAQEIVQEAKNKAAAIVEDAKAQAKQNVSDAEAAAKEEAKAALAQAEKEGEDEKQKYASEVQKQLDDSTGQAMANAEEAVNAIVEGLV